MGQNLNAGLPDHKAKLYLLTHDIWLTFIQVLSSFNTHIFYYTLHKVQLILLEFIAKRYDFFMETSLKSSHLENHERRCDNNIKFDFGEIGDEDAS
jgi:hypothetical protein